jgi:hypothetical protein
MDMSKAVTHAFPFCAPFVSEHERKKMESGGGITAGCQLGVDRITSKKGQTK